MQDTTSYPVVGVRVVRALENKSCDKYWVGAF